MRVPRTASSDTTVLADTMLALARDARGRVRAERAARRVGRSRPGDPPGSLRVGSWVLVDEEGALVARRDDGARLRLGEGVM